MLDHEDLSDAIHERRDELRQHLDQWIPDVLDFLLRVSKDPLTAGGLDSLRNVKLDDLVTPQLTWAEIEKDDPIDRNDRMWRIPQFSDASSDEDLEAESIPTSPASTEHDIALVDDIQYTPIYERVGPPDTLKAFQDGAFGFDADEVRVTEVQALRETLFMLQGLPTALFSTKNQQIKLNRNYNVGHMSSEVLTSILSQAILIAKAAATVRDWSFHGDKQVFIHVLQDHIHATTRNFDALLSSEQAEILKRMEEGGVCSLLAAMDRIYQNAQPIFAAAQFVSTAKNRDAIDLLSILFEQVCKLELCGQKSTFEHMLAIFCETLKAFSSQIGLWVENGRPSDQAKDCFIERVNGQDDKAKFWHNWYSLHTQGPKRLPDFLQRFSQRIFVAGKTVAFLKLLPSSPQTASPATFCSLAEAIEAASGAATDSIAPFAPSLCANLERYINESLSRSTASLQQVLETHCKITDTLSTLSHLYLAEAPYSTSIIDEQTFRPLDCGRTSWNDRYMISDIMEDAFAHKPYLDLHYIVVQSEKIPRVSIRDARQSAKVLESIAVDYKLPWPTANVISTDSIASYRRVALTLSQIRRARYVLERHAFPNLRKHGKAKVSVEGICTNLLLFTSILYSHLMHCAVKPLTDQLRAHMSGSVDEMIVVHKSYTTALERACLTTKNLKVLRETMNSLLDLCISFGFQVAEAKSEIDGFILSKIKTQFRKFMNLLIAGLRGSARASAASPDSKAAFTSRVGDIMSLLADSLESASFKM